MGSPFELQRDWLTQYGSWEVVGQKIVGSLAETCTNILNTGMSLVADYISPMRKARAAAGMAGGVMGDLKDMFDSDDEEEDASGEADGSGDPKPRRKKRRPAAQENLTDPAYTHISSTMPHLEIMLEVLTSGPSKGVNWDKAIGDPEIEDSRRTAVYLRRVLSSAKDSFALLATQTEPSREYTSVLTTVTQASEHSVSGRPRD